MSRPALLHNMSSPPRSAIQHRAPASSSRTALYQLPPIFQEPDPTIILTSLDRRPWTEGAQKAETELRRRINEHALSLPFPPAVLAANNAGARYFVDDLLTVCTVLAKSSDRVYLRDKEPNLDRIEFGRRITLRFPGALEPKV